MSSGNARLVICDLDGTLADTVPGIAHALNHVMGRLGFGSLGVDAVRRHIGGGARNLVTAVLGRERASLVPETLAAFSEYYDSRAEWCVTLYPGVRDTLATLHGSMLVAVATAKSRAGTERIFARTGIADYFDEVVTASEMTRPKPDPQCIETILERLHVPPDEAVLVGDTPTDARTAHNAGVAFWAVSYGYGLDDLRREGDYDRMVDNFADLQQLALANVGGLEKGTVRHD